MKLVHADLSDKGWFIGPWNSDLAISVGYANRGINEPHLHTQITEIYLVASGTTEIRIEKETFKIQRGDIVIIEPGEAHTFLSSSPDYFHFVVHTPDLSSEKARKEKSLIPGTRLGI